MKNPGSHWMRRYVLAIEWFIPPAARRSPELLSRAQNVVNAALMAALSGPFYALLYYLLGFPVATVEILACCAFMFAAPFLLRARGSIFLAREMFVSAAFFNFVWLSYHLGGVSAPTTSWLITPPVAAMLIGGIGTAMFWLAMSCAAIIALHVLPLMGVALPPVPVENMALLRILCELGLFVIVVSFVLLFEVTKTQGFVKLEKALDYINALAIRDELTGSHNRRHLLELIEREQHRSARAGRPFCVCLLDIDFFKRVNDTYGHSAGDTVLRTFAHAVAAQVRDIDSFGRYGGEEFLLMLPETRLDAACLLVERIRAHVETLAFPDIREELCLSVSIGVAQYRDGETIAQMIARADEALYLAKSGGRNRVVCNSGHLAVRAGRTAPEFVI
ncbi:diguanylate cyclase [Massilia sp. R2A-15]|uniref:GGDEF domain-containing protein n=1 Tax=Massilia sp. R2A-15 TaxID=3064278 RepID=UPI0027335390|nr:sensor domain-containing diguanylate cyclase [Massilia sp. R2A-15]WLI89612.1 diguanylate cyclase [Massilia sp. R2A-15]